MIYYTYFIDDKEYSMTEDEHKRIVNEINKGIKFLILRGGELVINANYIKTAKIDMESVEKDAREQRAKENEKLYKLPDLSDEMKIEKYDKERKKVEEIRKNLTKKLGWQNEQTTNDKNNL